MNARRVAAIGIFAALAYAGSFVLFALPNVTLSILIVFYAGFYLESLAGMAVGIIAALIISLFNPYGLAPPPVLVAQVLGYALVGLLGSWSRRLVDAASKAVRYVWLVLMGIVSALVYMTPVSVADAYLFGPFWERLALSAPFVLVTVGSNVLFFVILFPVLAKLKKLGIFPVD